MLLLRLDTDSVLLLLFRVIYQFIGWEAGLVRRRHRLRAVSVGVLQTSGRLYAMSRLVIAPCLVQAILRFNI